MKIRYNHASLDYRRVIMPQEQFQAALNKGMNPQQAMKAAYPGAGGAGPMGSTSTVRAPGRSVPNPSQQGLMSPPTQANKTGAAQNFLSAFQRMLPQAQQLGLLPQVLTMVQQFIGAGKPQQVAGISRPPTAGPPSTGGMRQGPPGTTMAAGGGIPRGGMAGGGMPPRRPGLM